MMNLDLLIPKDAPKGGSWAWAKITTGYDSEGDYFVNVRLDGEDADLEAAPIFLCDPEEFYDTGAGSAPIRTGRSLVQLLDGQVYVYGEGGGLPRAPADKIAAGEYAARSGRILWSHAGGPAMHIGDGGTGWWDFAPTEGGTTAWRTTLTGFYAGGPPAGMTFYDTTLGQLMVWSGSVWVAFAPVPVNADLASSKTNPNGLTYAGTLHATENSRITFRKRNGTIYLDGIIWPAATAHSATLVSGIPAAWRPEWSQRYVAGSNASAGRYEVDVQTDGDIALLKYASAPADMGTSYVIVSASYPATA